MKLDWNLVAEEIRNSVKWQKQQARQFLPDRERYLAAAESLEQLADDLLKPEHELARQRIEKLIGDDISLLKEAVQNETRSLNPPWLAADFLECVTESITEKLTG